jgi:oligopeptide transport system permease protein
MGPFLVRRLFHGLAVLWAVATLTFVLMHITPGGPFDREQRLPPQVMANLHAKYHLDQPLWNQYFLYVKGLVQGDLGPSYKYLHRTVTDIVASTLPVSALLGILALAFAIVVSLPTGLLAAYYHNSWADRWCLFLATLGISLPNFILGALLIWFFSLQLGWFQAGRWGSPASMVLPTITLGAAPAAYLSYLLRSTLIGTLGEDYIRTARAKGLSFIVEYVFAIPGMGRFFITAVTDRDYPMIMGVTLVYSALLVGANLAVDMLYSVTDPRVKTR